jgi:heme/copper-type cytochrome/quinol oxidase subunit 2
MTNCVVNRWEILLESTLFVLIILLSPMDAAERRQSADVELSGDVINGVREITVGAYKYGYYPNPIVVNYGERVRLLMTAADVPHGIRIPEFKVNMLLPLGVTKIIDFTASQKGEFMVHCSVYCGPNHGKQKTRLIVR